MGLPTLTFRVGFTTAPLATVTWANQGASKLLAFSSERGRSHELDDFAPGTASVSLDNRDRAYDPANTSGANFGNLKARKRCGLQATFNAITYDVFDMHAKAWPQAWQMLYGRCELSLSDAFEMFGREVFASTGARAAETSDARIGFILDQFGWPAGRRTFNTGFVTVQAYDYDSMNVMSHMQTIAQAEGGFLFIDGAGNVVFQDKYKRVRDYATSQATFSDSPTGAELAYVDIERDAASVDDVINHQQGKLANNDAATLYDSADSTSNTDYGPAGRSPLELWAVNPPEVEARVAYMVARYKQPDARITSITIDPQMDDLLWPQVLGRVIGERITVVNRYFGKGSAMTQESRIEGIRHEYQAEPLHWRTTFRLSPVSSQELAGYWLLGTSTLGTDTVPAW